MNDPIDHLYRLWQAHPAVSTDSRRIGPGALFFALRGERFDGNAYAAAALAAGAAAAAAAVVDDPKVVAPDDPRYVLVADSLAALQQLAAARRRRDRELTVLAITGSNGKTTTKELVARVLSKKFRTAVTEGNLNNHIGVPLTLLSMPPGTEIGVVEMGANHRGEIAQLCAIAQPDYGLITNIGLAHLEGFGTPEGVKAGKGELFDDLAARGATAFYNRDDDALAAMVAARPALKTIPYSAAELEIVPGGEALRLRWRGREVASHLTGDYNRANIAAAIAVGTHFEVSADDIVAAIESYRPDNNRSQRIRTAHNTLILDAYNANPSSMQAALAHFANEPGPRAVILGDMLELGDYAPQAHRDLVKQLADSGIDTVLLVGPAFTRAAGPRYATFPDVAALNAHLDAHPLRGYTILIKGSRGMRLEESAEFL